MRFVRHIGRTLLAPMFVSGGLDAFLDPASKVRKARAVTSPLASSLGMPDDPIALVRFNGGVQAIGGALLGLGAFTRLAAFTLAASLVPTTLAGHRFWEETDAEGRAAQRVQFFKNAAMLGGLVLLVADGG